MHQQINFYQPEFRNLQAVFGAMTLLKACGAIILTMVFVYVFATQKLTNVENELQIVSQQEVATIERQKKIQPVVRAVSGELSWSERLDDATRSLEEKQLVLSLVQGSKLGDTLGFSRYLRSLARQDTDGVWLTQIRLSALGDKNQLHGKALRADLVASHLQSLADEPPFATQRFHQFQIEGSDDKNDSIVTFSMNSESQMIASAGNSK